MFTRFDVQKTHYFPHTVHCCCSSVLCLSEMRRFSQSSSFWEARCALIGQLSSAYWRIPQVCDGNVMLLAISRRDEAKTIKPIINEVFVAFSEDIITDYNDSYGIFTCCIVPRKHNNISAFVFVETPNKHYSTLLKTCVWIVRSKFFKY